MNIRLIIGSLLIALGTGGALAATPQIVINPGSSDEKAIALSSISKIQFTGSGMEISGNEDFMVPFADITKIVFTSASSEVTTPVAEADRLSLILNPGGSSLSIAGITEPTGLEIFSISGLKVLSQPAYCGEEINTSFLPSDVYIIRIGNQYFKFIKH